MNHLDALIATYADTLQDIYDARTAGEYTFVGVLGEFARKVVDAEHFVAFEHEQLTREEMRALWDSPECSE